MKARPTIYNGIEMRSRLEARWAHTFDRLGLNWSYEDHAYATNTTPDQYLPDFRIEDKNGLTFVEIKPPIGDHEMLRVKERMEIIWRSFPDANLWVIRGEPGSHTVDAVMPIGDADIDDPILYNALGWWRTYGPVAA